MAEYRRRRMSARKTVRREMRAEVQRLEGVWQPYRDKAAQSLQTSADAQHGILLPSVAPIAPQILYGFNLIAAVAMQGSTAPTTPIWGVIAITKLNAQEVISELPSLTSPNPTAANTRPWRFWAPYFISGYQGDPWRFSPIRLPLKGEIKLDTGQQLAIMLGTGPYTGTSNQVVTLTVVGRYRVIHEQTS